MSIGIIKSDKVTRPSTGIACPVRIMHTLVNPERYFIHDFTGSQCVITEVTSEYIIFKFSDTYNEKWSPYIVIRKNLIPYPDILTLYDTVVTCTKPWGTAAEIALEFLEKTLE